MIAGNHDMTFDHQFINRRFSIFPWNINRRENEHKLRDYGAKTVQDLMTNCTYLEDSTVEIYGIKIFGSPWCVGLYIFFLCSNFCCRKASCENASDKPSEYL